MFKLTEKIKNWLIENSDTRMARVTLGVISFAESSFFPIPPDIFLAPMVVAKPTKWLKYASIVTIFSVVGGLFGYLIGLVLFHSVAEPLINFYHWQDEVARVGEMFANNSFVAIFVAAFTPIPYKVFTIAAGIFRINIFIFIVASILGRGIRFFILAGLMKFIGEKYGNQIFKYFNYALITLIILVAIYFIVV